MRLSAWWLAAVITLKCAMAMGKGPIGIYAIDDRYALTADSAFNGLFVVDVWRGGVVAAKTFPAHDGPEAWVSMTGVASCPNCAFAYATSTHGSGMWRIDFEMPLSAMARSGNFSGFARGRVVARGAGFPGSNSFRMIAISTDGSRGFVTENSRGVYFFRPRDQGDDGAKQPLETRLVVDAKRKDSLMARGGGLSGTALSRNETLLYITAETKIYAFKAGSAPQDNPVRVFNVGQLCGIHGMHLRESAEVGGELYVVGHPPDAGMAVFRVSAGKCVRVVGEQKKTEGWRDGVGHNARFSRPHQMIRFAKTDLLLTDIDNRALRRVEPHAGTDSGHVSTVPYDDHLYRRLWGDRFPAGTAAAASDAARAPLPAKNNLQARNTSTRVRPAGVAFDALAPAPNAPSAPSPQTTDAGAAAAFCADRHGAGLCSPAALRKATLAADRFGTAVWTSQTCRSCWLRWPGECAASSGGEKDAWGGDFQMMANFASPAEDAASKDPAGRARSADPSAAPQNRIRFECAKAKVPRNVHHLCCHE